MNLLLRWAASAAAVWVATRVVEGIRVEGGVAGLLAVALILGLVNALGRPLLRWLSCGVIVFTLGLFLLVINALLLLLAAWIARSLGVGFFVDGFVAALLGSLVISVVSFVLSLLFPERE
jgi:putative membrane protein